jgi:hypothetical protein
MNEREREIYKAKFNNKPKGNKRDTIYNGKSEKRSEEQLKYNGGGKIFVGKNSIL